MVEFHSRRDGRRIDVAATGMVTAGNFSEPMVPVDTRGAAPGRSFALAGARDRSGVFDVRVTTEAGERFDWTDVRVARDFCGLYTVVLRATPVRE
ncbi:MAG: hypothetical protein AB7G13_31160 [Lautropia sp.]